MRGNWEPNAWKKMGRNDYKITENVKKEKMEGGGRKGNGKKN